MTKQIENQVKFLKNEIIKMQQENSHLKKILNEAQIKLQKERTFLFSLIDGIPAYVYLQADDFSIKYANKMFYELYGGYDIKPCYKVLHNRDIPCENCMTFRVFETKEPQIWMHRDALSGKIYRVYDYPFVDYEGTELVLEMGIDITAQQSIEDSRLNLYANISHDLRTPITKIMGYSEALMDVTDAPEERQKYAQCIFRNSLALVKLVDDLFQLSKLETRNRLTKKLIEPSLCFADFLDEQAFYFNEKGQNFSYNIQEDLPFIEADFELLIEALVNIIDNAVRYTQKGDNIVVNVYAQDENLMIAVSDSGRGIAPNDLKYIFNRFYQPGSKKSESVNSGLGLHICKTIVMQHGGLIWAESELGKGSIFYISIPFDLYKVKQ
ncbi:sensor histidine kinase [Acetobacterium woodii]|uniref:histidine kinase n=1 Tax=Acetobacterium woodii (strain ATCC 29683 / DSM 1030 / JCM 2381 / KCTC 1655 / WB1) TaxID=931626 RepID=H6LJR6_ACEWD|nr:HAMP domain-containing sensor histidine kinase [Acetobacterium woodii]AFA47467.1 two-component system sensor histidine kinase [Acetobacterium woodii DSM 1030]